MSSQHPPALDERDVAKRFVHYLNVLFRGSQSEMARELGCSQPLVSKIRSGKQPPGPKLLAALAQHPKVNPAWLLSGEGEPLLAARETTPADGWPVPIADHILRGATKEHLHELSGRYLPVAGAVFAPTRYWLEINAAASQGLRTERFRQGDLLLIETSTETWLANPDSLEGRLVVIWVGPQSRCYLGRCGRVGGSSAALTELVVQPLDSNQVFRLAGTAPTGDRGTQIISTTGESDCALKKDETVGKLPRRIDLPPSAAETNEKPAPPAPAEPAEVQLSSAETLHAELVGVAVFLWGQP